MATESPRPSSAVGPEDSPSDEHGSYLQAFPAQGEVLRAMRRVRQWQESLLSEGAALTQLDPQLALARLASGQPVLAGERLALDEALFAKAANELSSLLPIDWPLRLEIERLMEILRSSTRSGSDLATSYAMEKSEVLADLAAKADAQPATVAFVLDATLGPFFERTARMLNLSPEVLAWGQGSCPVCGNQPFLSRLATETGKRWLSCHLCRTEWAFPRIKCAFCGEARPDKLVCLSTNDIPGRRIDACETCKRYVKSVDERVVGQVASLHVEDVITARLDVLAMSQGFL